MDGKRNYFLFNKRSDYERGFLHEMAAHDGGICACGGLRSQAVFISRVLDSKETQMDWHRLEIKGNEGHGTAFRLSVYAADTDSFLLDGQSVSWNAFIKDEAYSVVEKLSCMEPYLQKRVMGMNDILLHEVRGRYLWIAIQMYRQPTGGMLRDIRISFPRQTWMQYLPEIYQQEDAPSMFLERYLGIFQTLYEDVGERIAASAQLFDMETAPEEFLDTLAQWLSISQSHIWSKEQLGRLLKNAVSLYKRRGTRQGILDFVRLYTGEEPFLVENHELLEFAGDKAQLERLERLYGSSPYAFTLLVRAQAVPTVHAQKTLTKILDDVRPAQTQMNLVVLKPYLFLDAYSYLGVNSVLGKYTNMTLDGQSTLPFAVLGAQGAPVAEDEKGEENAYEEL